jgi:hypothetical protein
MKSSGTVPYSAVLVDSLVFFESDLFSLWCWLLSQFLKFVKHDFKVFVMR